MSVSDDPIPNQFPPIKKTDQLVYIFNMSEDVWPFIDAISDPAKKAFEIQENANLCDRELFSLAEEQNAIFICPQAMDADFLEYATKLLRITNLQLLVPEKHSGEISKDCINDSRLFEQLVTIGKASNRLVLFSYSTTWQFLELVAALRAAGVDVYTPESPNEEQAWTVNFFGSKSGIRQLVQKSAALEPDLLMPDGLICVGARDAARIAASKYIKEHGVVIKTNKGHSGAGVLILREGELPDNYEECEQAILKILQSDEYWELFPIVIETLVNVNPAVGGGFPNVEFRIRKSGEVELLYFCGLRVTKDGVFKGVEINEDVLNDRIQARLVDTGFFVGEQLASAGYRGFFDVDVVAGKNGQLYVSESNVRRTGGTFSYQATEALIGKNFMNDSYTLTNTGYTLPTQRIVTFREVKELLEPVLYNPKTKEGVVLAGANLFNQHQMAYIVYGKTKKRSIELEEQMYELLTQL